MNAMLNIVVRVNTAQARAQLKALQAQGAGLASGMNAGAGASGGFGAVLGKAGGHMMSFGKNLQWTGQQLQYNFTLPILLAGGAATKFALDNEKAMTNVRKVYGDSGTSAKTLNKDLKLLETSFRLLSDRFGVHQSEVIEIGAAWAQAGVSGVALARVTKETLQAMIIGEMDAQEATLGLIAVQSAYGLSSRQLHDSLAMMNQIENDTAVSFEGLIDVVTRAGGSARSAGVDIRHLSAMAASLVPTTGSASQAGNALKTMISRLMVPTREASEVMGAMGINIYDASWQAKNGVERFESLGVAFEKLTQPQKNVVSAMIASRWQINRFDVLMADIINTNGRYQKALDVTADKTKYLATYTRELTTYLSSTPQRWKILTTQIQNAMASAILPMLPAIGALLYKLVAITTWFSKLSPTTQQWVMSLLLLLAIVGPITKMIGAFTVLGGLLLTTLGGLIGVLFGNSAAALAYSTALGVENISLMQNIRLLVMKHGILGLLWIALTRLIMFPFVVLGRLMAGAFMLVFHPVRTLTYLIGLIAPAFMGAVGAVGSAIAAIGTAIAGLPVWVVVAIAAVVVALGIVFRKQIGGAVDWVIKQFQRLPESVVRVFVALVNIVKKFALLVYEWLSYINPFAHHSPSLVEQVNAGVNTILNDYKRLRGIGAIVQAAARAHENFNKVTAPGKGKVEDHKYNEQKVDIVAWAPTAGPAVDGMIAGIKALKNALVPIGVEIAKQSRIVTYWADALERADQKLDAAQTILDKLTDRASALNDQLQAAEKVLDDLANMPIKGMRAMEDQIFANEMAQKRLRLEIMQMEDAYGGIDEARDKLSKLAGEIENLKAEQTSLREAGAGSDITAVYDEQISALEAQQQAIEAQVAPINELQRQLDALGRTAEMLNLTQSLQFDPLTRQIYQATHALKEMPFDEILAAINEQLPVVDALREQWNKAEAAVTAQKASVDQLKAARDALAAVYDRENSKLEKLNQAYNDIEAQIRDMESALSDFASMAKQALEDAKKATDEISEGMKQFEAAGQADFEVPGGNSLLDEKGSIEEFNKQMEAELEKSMKSMGKLDMFAPIKNMWKSTWKWVKDNVGPYVTPVIDGVKEWWNNLDLDIGGISFSGAKDGMFDGIKNAWHSLEDAFLKSPIASTWNNIVSGIQSGVTTVKIWLGMVAFIFTNSIVPIFDQLKESATNAFSKIGDKLKSFSGIWDKLIEAVGHIFNVLSGLWSIAMKVGMVFVGMFAAIAIAVWTVLSPIVKNVIEPIFDMIVNTITTALDIIRNVIEFVLNIINGDWKAALGNLGGIVKTMWNYIYNIFKNALRLVWGLVWGAIQGIGNLFKLIYNYVPGVKTAVDAIVGVFNWLWQAIQSVWDGITTGANWMWQNVLYPILAAIGDFIMTKIVPIFEWFAAVIKTVFQIIGAVIQIASLPIRAILYGIFLLVKNVIVPIFLDLWEKIKFVFSMIRSAIQVAWAVVIKPVFTAIKDYIVGTLIPKFQAFLDKVKTVWGLVKSAISAAWDIVRPIFGSIRDWIVDVLMAKFTSFKDRVVDVWDTLKEKTKSAFTAIKDSIKGSINTGIDVINKLIGGMNKISDVLPGVDFSIDLIPRLAKGGPVDRIAPTATKVGNGFVTNRPRAIVGEGSPAHPEFVIPTDPRYRARAMGLFHRLGTFLGGSRPGSSIGSAHYTEDGIPMAFAGIEIPSPGDVVNAVKGSAEWVGDKVQKGAAMAAFAPFNLAADQLLKLVKWELPRESAKNAKNKMYDWAKGTDDGLNSSLAAAAEALANIKHKPGVNMDLNKDFLKRYSSYNAELGNPFTVVSGKRTYAQQVALWLAYLAGTGNLAAKPGTSNHESGYALDHAPGTSGKAARYMDMAKKHGLKYPVPGEDWHVEPIVRMARGGAMPKNVFDDYVRRQKIAEVLDPRIDAAMANGGMIVGSKPGGAVLRVGEVGADEKIQVTPLDGKHDDGGGGSTVNHFHGNLVFPNVTNGDDAEDFIKSLESLGS